MGLMMKIFDIMGVHWKIWLLQGLHKKPVYSRELPKKQVCTIYRDSGGTFEGRGGGWYSNAHYELASLADSYASLSCFSKSHSDYTRNISSTLLPRKHM